MRRVLALVLLAAAGCVVAGLTIPTDAVAVGSETLSHAQFNDELAAIDASPEWQCYLEATAFLDNLATPQPVEGVASTGWNAAAATEWANSRAIDLVLIGYVQHRDPAALSPASVAAARPSLETAITTTVSDASADAQHFACATGQVSGSEVLASMPAWFQQEQLTAQAARLGLATIVPNALPTSGAALESWFAAHANEFQTTCLSLIVTTEPTIAEEAAAAIAGGMSFADAAKKYSQDTSASKGGEIGCISPASTLGFEGVQEYAGDLKVGEVSQVTPVSNGQTGDDYYLFLVTKRTPHTFEEIGAAVAALNKASNERAAALLSEEIAQAADVSVSPTLGTWDVSTQGSTIVPPPSPPAGSVTNVAANTPTTPTS